MSKGLEELKKIELKWQYGVFTFIPNFEIIEKELKALEIIKDLFNLNSDDFYYNDISDDYVVAGYRVSKEVYDFLKEVLLCQRRN